MSQLKKWWSFRGQGRGRYRAPPKRSDATRPGHRGLRQSRVPRNSRGDGLPKDGQASPSLGPPHKIHPCQGWLSWSSRRPCPVPARGGVLSFTGDYTRDRSCSGYAAASASCALRPPLMPSLAAATQPTFPRSSSCGATHKGLTFTLITLTYLKTSTYIAGPARGNPGKETVDKRINADQNYILRPGRSPLHSVKILRTFRPEI